jgi:hypothetical protein
MAQVVDHLPSKHKALSSNSNNVKKNFKYIIIFIENDYI